jgi:hypothetical protein
LLAYFAEWFLVLIQPALIAQGEILGKLEVIQTRNGVNQLVSAWFEVQLAIEEGASAAFLALEALLAFPLAFRDGF